MKKNFKTLGLGSFILLAVIYMLSCGKSDSTTPTATSSPPCATPGTSVNIGSTVGGYYGQNVSPAIKGSGPCSNVYYYDAVDFDNRSLDFSLGYVGCTYNGNAYIMDVGPQTCLNFSYSGTATAQTIAYVNGHGYVGFFTGGHIVKFIAGSYNNGVVNISYIFQ